MNYAHARKAMVDGQLTPNKVTHKKLLACMGALEREHFVDLTHKEYAYKDGYATLSGERKMMSPLACARLIQELNPTEEDKTLVLAAGSGYSAVLLASLVKEVHAVEEKMNLFEMAKRSMFDVKCRSVKLHEGKPEKGYATLAPYDKILIDAPVEFIPNDIWSQLKEGGKLAALVVEKENICTATLYEKTAEGTVLTHKLFETGGTALANFKKPKAFTF